LKTGFCEIRRPKPAPVKAFAGIAIKKIRQIRPEGQNGSHREKPSELYFDGEIHNEPVLRADS
jgi:hypothetical protein